MSSRNQNHPPRSPNSKKEVGGVNKKTRGGEAARVAAQTDRKPFSSSNKKQEATPSSEAVGSHEGSECENVNFSKEEIEALVNGRLKVKKSDLKGKLEVVSDLNKRLKVCIRWFQKNDEAHMEEDAKLRNALESSERKCNDMELELNNKSTIITELRNGIDTLQVRLSKEEAEKQDALDCHAKEIQTRITAEDLQASLSKQLEKAQEDIAVAIQRAASLDDMYKRLQEYNLSLQQYNSKLHAELEMARESLKRVEKEKSTIVENLSSLRGHYTSIQDQLNLARTAQDEAVTQKELLVNEVKCLRGELTQVREDRDRQVAQVQTLSADVAKYQETTGKFFSELDNLTMKTKSLEDNSSLLRGRIQSLEQQLSDANEKLEMAGSSATEIQTKYKEQAGTISRLEKQLADTESKLAEGENLRKKLHNTILELKGNIRVFCRVRPLLPDDGTVTEPSVISYPTSTEALGRGIDLTPSGQKHPFTFDKVFSHDASQQIVFEEISQLVQSALDGYKVCIFAYGQTGSGKTYTMMGTEKDKGLIPRSLEQIFKASLLALGWKYKMQVSMLEIYNETIRDLLTTNGSSGTESSGATHKQYTIKHDANGNTHVSDLTIVDVTSNEEIAPLWRKAAQSRSVGRTHMNEQSSRSHFVFTLRISGVNEATEQQVQGVLNLIDLAGSERLSKSGSTGDRLKETQAINKSLSSLADVIFALAKKEDHVPFRNSKLTYLLQPCLGGDSKTLMFVNISPDPSSVGESLCSLRFAARVNACEIGVPRRQMTSSSRPPADNRLSCG